VTFGKNQLKQTLNKELALTISILESNKKRKQSLSTMIKNVENKLISLSKVEKEYYILENSKKNINKLISKVENRLIEINLAMESNVNDFEVLERAKPSIYPESSGRKLITLSVMFVTFFIIIGYKVFYVIISPYVKSSFDLEKFELDIISLIPNNDLYPNTNSEQFELLFQNYRNSTQSIKNQIIVILSDIRNSGKSYLSTKLIEKFTHINKKNIFIEHIESYTSEIEINLISNNHLFPKNYIEKDGYKKLYSYIEEDDTLHKDKIHKIQEMKNKFDLIIWELPSFDLNNKLFFSIAEHIDSFIIIADYLNSSKSDISKIVQFIKLKNRGSIKFGVINNIPKQLI
jgi:hypothetical protein